MKRLFTLLACAAVVLCAHAQNTPSAPVTKNPNTHAIKEDLVFGAGRTLNMSAGTLTLADGQVTWPKVSKAGSSLADLATRSAADLTSGTLPDARFPATLPALSGANLTALNASNLANGTVSDARLSANVSLLGSAIDLSGAEATGILAAARFPALTGDVTTSAGAVATTLATVNANVGTFGSATQSLTATVDAKGRVIAMGAQTVTPAWSSITSKPTTVAGYGIADAYTITQVDSLSRGQRPGLISAGTSIAGTTQDNSGLAIGTNDFTIGLWVRLPDWTPSERKWLVYKIASNVGFDLFVDPDGTIGSRIFDTTGATYKSTTATNVPDGAWAFMCGTYDRDGNAVWTVNAAALGSPVNISATAARSISVGGALSWMGQPAPSNIFTTGSIGECWIIAGILTPQQVSDINRVGSIIPFCTFTPNATTGQNVATIGGLSFYQLLDFGQGYGPIIRDRSGNNQHALVGTSGLTHVTPRNPPGTPQRAPRTALLLDGGAPTNVASTLGSQTLATGEFVLWQDFYWTPGTAGEFCGIRVTKGTPIEAQNLRFTYGTGIGVVLYGATVNDYNLWSAPGLATLTNGRRGVFAMTRPPSGNPRFYLGLDGEWTDITNLGSFSTLGSPPTWQGNITGSNFVFAPANPISLFDLRLANVAMPETELREAYLAGESQTKWNGASKALLNTLTCADIDYGAGFSAASTTGFTAVAAAGNHFARVQPTFPVVVGQRVRISGTLTLNNGKTVLPSVRLTSSAPVGIPSSGEFSVDVVSSTAGNTAGVNFDSNGDADYTISNLKCSKIGWTTRLRTDGGFGFQARNDASSSTNDSSPFEISTSGTTWSPTATEGRRTISRSYVHSDISSTAATTACLTLPRNVVLREVQLNRSVTFDAGTTLNVGISGTPAKFVSATSVAGTGFAQAPSLSAIPESTTGATTVYVQKSGATTSGNVTLYFVIEAIGAPTQ